LLPRLRLYAALIVDAVMASAGDIFICVQASDKIIGMLGVGDEPGLKSVASTTECPVSIISRARGYHLAPSAYTEPGSRTGCTFAFFNAAIPCSSACSRWSAVVAHSSAISFAPPELVN